MTIAGPAFAHPGHAESGFLHPLTGADHVLAMVGAGMWAALLSTRRPVAALLVPAAFMAMMAAGAAAGFAGIKLPFSEAGVLASIFMLGGLVMAAVRLPLAAGHAGGWIVRHAARLCARYRSPCGDPGRYIMGFLVATALLHALGLGLGKGAQRLVGDLGLRAMGGLVLAGGAWVLVAH